jgi:hypothetical protein
MAHFEATVQVTVGADRVWARLVDWPAHGRWVPLTTVRVLSPSPTGIGARFVGRTGIGPLGFDDPMTVVVWQPPEDGGAGVCEVVKQGRVLLGGARLEVTPTEGGSRVIWSEDVELAPVRLTRPVGPLLAAAGRLGFTRALQAMARELEAEAEAERRGGGGG